MTESELQKLAYETGDSLEIGRFLLDFGRQVRDDCTGRGAPTATEVSDVWESVFKRHGGNAAASAQDLATWVIARMAGHGTAPLLTDGEIAKEWNRMQRRADIAQTLDEDVLELGRWVRSQCASPPSAVPVQWPVYVKISNQSYCRFDNVIDRATLFCRGQEPCEFGTWAEMLHLRRISATEAAALVKPRDPKEEAWAAVCKNFHWTEANDPEACRQSHPSGWGIFQIVYDMSVKARAK